MPETELQVTFFIYYLLKAKGIGPHLGTQNNLRLESIETNCVLTSFKNIRGVGVGDTHDSAGQKPGTFKVTISLYDNMNLLKNRAAWMFPVS